MFRRLVALAVVPGLRAQLDKTVVWGMEHVESMGVTEKMDSVRIIEP